MKTARRIVSAAFGVFLVGVGVYAAFYGVVPRHWAVLGGLVLVLLGGNLVYSAYRDRSSWLSRIGPLP
jgi:putative Mn2+ efflux pump MntP